MKSLFKLKKILIISGAVMLPISGVAIAAPLLTQQYSISAVQQKDVSEIKLAEDKKVFADQVDKIDKVDKKEEKKEPNKIYTDSEGNHSVEWKEATIDKVFEELKKLDENKPKPEPVKPQVTVTIISKEEVVKPKPPVVEKPESEKTLVEKIFEVIKDLDGTESSNPEKIKELKGKIDKIKKDHFAQQSKSIK